MYFHVREWPLPCNLPHGVRANRSPRRSCILADRRMNCFRHVSAGTRISTLRDMSSSSQQSLFALLPRARKPWAEFVFSSGIQALIVAAFVLLRMVVPVISPMERSFHAIALVNTPPPVNRQPQPLLRLKQLAVVEVDPPVNALRLTAMQPKVAHASAEDTPAPVVSISARRIETAPTVAPVVPKQGVSVNVFLTGSSAVPTRAKYSSQVQTGGFGDPNGIPATAGQGKVANIAALGSFDLPSGPGYGNGTAGAKGVAAVVVSSGFGSETALPEHRPRVPQVVQTSGFGNVEAPAPSAAHARPLEAVRLVPAEITAKPVPLYTQEARNLRIQGEVLLEVVLEASGGLRVLRVVRGLGHGLDDNAVKAAQQIRFKPALRDGQPADSTVVLHVIFQLA